MTHGNRTPPHKHRSPGGDKKGLSCIPLLSIEYTLGNVWKESPRTKRHQKKLAPKDFAVMHVNDFAQDTGYIPFGS